MLRLQLFGAGHAWYGDRPVAGFPSQHPGLLLCYLVLNRHLPHQREQLATVFWGDHASQEARKYLRHVLWRLRQNLEMAGAVPNQYLSVGDEAVTFLPSAPYLLDTEVFEATLSNYQRTRGEKLLPEQAADIERVVHLYTGDLLKDVDADWCLHNREHLRLLFLNALDKLMLYYGAQGDYESALICGEQILTCDNTREKIHQRIIQFHWMSGNRSAAIAQYKQCVQILRDEMDIDPMEQTQRLYQLILHTEPDLSQALPPRNRAASVMPDASANLSGPLGNELIRRIHHLQAVVAQSSSELRALEQFVNTLLQSDQP